MNREGIPCIYSNKLINAPTFTVLEKGGQMLQKLALR